MSDVFDEEKDHCGQPDDFFQYILGVTSVSGEKSLKRAQKDYMQAQYELFLCLTTNFAQSDRAMIDRYQKSAVVARIMRQNPSLRGDDMWVRFVPFASLCYMELESKYDDNDGV